MDDRQRSRRLRRGLGRGGGDASLPRPAGVGRAASHRPRRDRDAPRGDAADARRVRPAVEPPVARRGVAAGPPQPRVLHRRPPAHVALAGRPARAREVAVPGPRPRVQRRRVSPARRARLRARPAPVRGHARPPRADPREPRVPHPGRRARRPRAPAPGDRPAGAVAVPQQRPLPALAGVVPELRVSVRARARPRLPRGRDVARHVRGVARAGRALPPRAVDRERGGRPPAARRARPRTLRRRGVGGRERAPRRGRARAGAHAALRRRRAPPARPTRSRSWRAPRTSSWSRACTARR